jgi:hypothetical protein
MKKALYVQKYKDAK